MSELHHSDRSGRAASEFDRSNRNDQEDINRARQVAEALFAPKNRVIEPAALPIASTEQSVRKPRILSAVPAQPAPMDPVKPSVKLVPRKKEKIPAAHFIRIRAWLKYGMTISQVAEVYGVTVGEIERILHKA